MVEIASSHADACSFSPNESEINRKTNSDDDEPPLGARRVRRSAPRLPVFLLSVLLVLSHSVVSVTAHPSPLAPLSPSLTSRDATQVLASDPQASTCSCEKDGPRKHDALFAVEATMIPVLVLLSGVFAGLTLGYMSLDTTQLNVLAKTGTPRQQAMAKRVIPIRKDGHLLLITLLLANMIVNETLPVIADGVLGGGIQAVVISTVLVVIFSEIIPQSVCSRFGLAIGSAMVWPTQILIYVFYIVAWPVARLLNWILGPHSGVVYRRAELKELISMHGDQGGHGGDLDKDTITIVGATLDLQAVRPSLLKRTKVVSDVMTPITKAFMLPITAKLDYETLGRVLKAGHSRIPVYEELSNGDHKANQIIGVLLTKQLILLDPEDAVPLRDIPMNSLPTVPDDLPLLQILNTFQEGRSHMAIVSRRRPGFYPMTTHSSKTFNESTDKEKLAQADSDMEKGEATGEQSLLKSLFHHKKHHKDSEHHEDDKKSDGSGSHDSTSGEKPVRKGSTTNSMANPDDTPIGIITLEDVLEELIGEEIYDESDVASPGQQPAMRAFIPPEAIGRLGPSSGAPAAPSAVAAKSLPARSSAVGFKGAAGRLGIKVGRSRSAPGKSRTPLIEPGAAVEPGKGILSPPTPIPDSIPLPPTMFQQKGATSTTVVTSEPESLALIVEATSSDGSDGEGEGEAAPEMAVADNLSSSMTLSSGQSKGILLQRNTPEGSGGGSTRPTATPVAPSRAPPLLADAVLLERGRRLLVAQGADPASLPPLRLAAPRSQPPSRSGTPVGQRIVVPAQTQAAVARKQVFKSPSLPSPHPIRQQSFGLEGIGGSGRSTPGTGSGTGTGTGTGSEDRQGDEERGNVAGSKEADAESRKDSVA